MTTLSIFDQSQPEKARKVTENPAEIRGHLARHGVRYEQWPTKDLPADASQEDILEAYSEEVSKLKQECGFQTADVISLNPDNPQKDAFRQKFLDEHTHSEDEVRFFVRGQGLFYLHFGNEVFAVLCQKNDLISVPDGTRHWFDMGPEPAFTCIRLFTNPEGWVADFTGEDIAGRLPRYESLAGVAGMIRVVLTDIEGTTSSISFVHDVLFPYASDHLPSFVRDQHQDTPAVSEQLDAVAEISGVAREDVEGLIEVLETWTREDRKETSLKTLQGMVWEQGYQQGELKGHIYADAADYLQRWHDRGLRLFVYSSGSVKAQKLIFGFTTEGDFTPFFSGYFDTRIGGKKKTVSYRNILSELGVEAGTVLFLSDVEAELEAAEEAGMQTAWLVREGDLPETERFVARDFAEVDTLLQKR